MTTVKSAARLAFGISMDLVDKYGNVIVLYVPIADAGTKAEVEDRLLSAGVSFTNKK
jgi:hypothetical protein